VRSCNLLAPCDDDDDDDDDAGVVVVVVVVPCSLVAGVQCLDPDAAGVRSVLRHRVRSEGPVDRASVLDLHHHRVDHFSLGRPAAAALPFAVHQAVARPHRGKLAFVKALSHYVRTGASTCVDVRQRSRILRIDSNTDIHT
jgi:hypothetical protein